MHLQHLLKIATRVTQLNALRNCLIYTLKSQLALVCKPCVDDKVAKRLSKLNLSLHFSIEKIGNSQVQFDEIIELFALDDISGFFVKSNSILEEI